MTETYLSWSKTFLQIIIVTKYRSEKQSLIRIRAITRLKYDSKCLWKVWNSLSFSPQISGAIVSVFAGYFIYQLHEYAPLTPDHVCGPSGTLLAMGVITCGIGWFAWQFLDFSNKGQVIVVSLFLECSGRGVRKFVANNESFVFSLS